MLWGYFSSAARRAPRYDDAEFRRFVRRYQHLALVVGKRAATRKIVAERAAVWRARHPGRGRRSTPCLSRADVAH